MVMMSAILKMRRRTVDVDNTQVIDDDGMMIVFVTGYLLINNEDIFEIVIFMAFLCKTYYVY